MQLVNIYGNLCELNSVLTRCCESKCFHIEPAIHNTKKIAGIAPLIEENPYLTALANIKSLASSLHVPLSVSEFDDVKLLDPCEFDEFSEKLICEYKTLNELYNTNQTELSQLEELLEQIEHLWGLDVNFEELFACKYIKLRIGKIPIESLKKLEYYDDENFIFVPFTQNEIYAWGMYFAP